MTHPDRVHSLVLLASMPVRQAWLESMLETIFMRLRPEQAEAAASERDNRVMKSGQHSGTTNVSYRAPSQPA